MTPLHQPSKRRTNYPQEVPEEALKLQVREPTMDDSRDKLLLLLLENALSSLGFKETSKSSSPVVDELSMHETNQLLNRMPPIQKELDDHPQDVFMRKSLA